MPPPSKSDDLDDCIVRAIVAYEADGEAALVRELAAAGPHAEAARQHIEWMRASGLLQECELPSHIGEYRVLQKIGSGGMGMVFLCEQETPTRRRVAVKVIRDGASGSELLARFRLEQRALAALEHPGIAALLDGGTDERGRPFLVMEHVAGLQLHRYCDERQLDGRARLLLFTRICDAVQHAHHKGIVHRDLKPSNVLVVDRDQTPWPVVIDFGVAKILGDRHRGATMWTLPGAMLGTPEYMSPEQATHEVDIDTRADVYSLGVMLYELLTGTLPIARERLRGREVAHVIGTTEPPTPSSRLTSLGAAAAAIADRRRTDVAGLRRLLRGDIDWVTMKALEKDRNRRYGMPAELAADVRRFLAHEPVSAGPASAWYRLKKLCARNRPQAFAAGAVLVVMAVALVAITWFWRNAVSATQASEASFDDAMAAVSELVAVGDSDLVDVPHLTAVRRGLIERSVVFYRRFVERAADDDPGLQSRVVDAQLRLGCLQAHLGDYAAAVATLREGEARANGLPAGTVEIALRARALDARSEAAEHVGDTGEALAAAIAAEQLLRHACEHRSDAELRSWLVRVLLRRGRQQAPKDAIAAHALTSEAAELARPFAAGDSADIRQWPLVIEAGAALANRLLGLSRREEALRELDGAFALWQRSKQSKVDPGIDWRLTTAVGEVAAVMAWCDDYERMIPVLAAVEAAYERLAADHPGVLAYRIELAKTRYHRATAQLRNHRTAEGVAGATQAEADFTAALALAPDDPTLLHDAARSALALSTAHLEARSMGVAWDFEVANAARERAAVRIERLAKSRHDASGVARLRLLERRMFAVLHATPNSAEVRGALADALRYADELLVHERDLELRERASELRIRYGQSLRRGGEFGKAREVLLVALDEQRGLRVDMASPELWITRRRVLVVECARTEAELGLTDSVLERLRERLALADNEDWIGKLEVVELLIEFAQGPLAADRERLLQRAREVVQIALEVGAAFKPLTAAITPAMIASMRAKTWGLLVDVEQLAGDRRAEARALAEVVSSRVDACRGSSSESGARSLRAACELWLAAVVSLGDADALVAAGERLVGWSVRDAQTLLDAARRFATFVIAHPEAVAVRVVGRQLVDGAIAAGADAQQCSADAALQPLLRD